MLYIKKINFVNIFILQIFVSEFRQRSSRELKEKIVARHKINLKVIHTSRKRDGESLKDMLVWIPKIMIVTFLATWMMTCYYYIPELMSTAMAGTTIIICLLFFHSAEQKGDYNNKY